MSEEVKGKTLEYSHGVLVPESQLFVLDFAEKGKVT
jgi:hypothetical protein